MMTFAARPQPHRMQPQQQCTQPPPQRQPQAANTPATACSVGAWGSGGAKGVSGHQHIVISTSNTHAARNVQHFCSVQPIFSCQLSCSTKTSCQGGPQAPWFAHLVLFERVSCFVFPAFSNASCVFAPLCSGFRPSCVLCFGPPVGLCSVLQPPPQHSARTPGPAPCRHQHHYRGHLLISE